MSVALRSTIHIAVKGNCLDRMKRARRPGVTYKGPSIQPYEPIGVPYVEPYVSKFSRSCAEFRPRPDEDEIHSRASGGRPLPRPSRITEVSEPSPRH
ncbi:hypothetical protein COMA2_20055 [Candidatus Nitrospira nitrificans]|uniref:Uncharacterized protein n=1 Tax=Candidatus Nitrospira nitrificans TaxID=1742973 RepID=A0A0S4LBM7_9BACT|nr:hypothetical protein COMA2_20055 [Candidatus Nitrospira nitrificans]